MAPDELAHMPEDAADDLTFHSPGGTAETKAAFVENLVSGRLNYDSVDGVTALARLHGQTVIVTGQVDIRFQSGLMREGSTV